MEYFEGPIFTSHSTCISVGIANIKFGRPIWHCTTEEGTNGTLLPMQMPPRLRFFTSAEVKSVVVKP